jgi:hypothetical protein
MTFQATEPDSQSTLGVMASSPSTVASKDQYNTYQYMYNTPKQQSFFMSLRTKIEMIVIYTWVLIQTLFLIAGLTVLHFSTFSVMVVYLVNGVIKGRRELLPQK